MIVVKTYLGPDRFGGTGLFADEDIKKGDVIWRFDPATTRIYSLDEYRALIAKNDDIARTLIKYAYPCFIEQNGIMTPVLFQDLDNGAYINHSEDTNVGHIDDDHYDHPHYDDRFDVNVALRDIPRGTEITNNYYTFDDADMSITKQVDNCCTFLATLPRDSKSA